MKVLFLAHRIPFPPNKGDKIRAFNVLRHLAGRHEVSLGTLVDEAGDERFVPELARYARHVAWARLRPRADRLLAMRNVLTREALSVAYFHSKSLQRQVDDLLNAGDFDAIVCSSSPMAEYLFRAKRQDLVRRARRVMDLIDVDSLKWGQYASKAPPWTAWIYRHEARYLAAYEQKIAREFDSMLVVSEQEREIFPGGAPANLLAVPNGVDVEMFAPREAPASSAKPALVFTGVMDYWPNIEGITWFVQDVLPRIREAVPEVELFIVGSRPTADVQRLGQAAGITVTGFVDDVRTYLARAAVCVVPLRIARGIQNKVLEAMAMGRPVVTTQQAYEGVKACSGEDIVVAPDEAAFASSVVDLLRDSARAEQIGRAARVCMERNYSWAANLAPLDAILEARR